MKQFNSAEMPEDVKELFLDSYRVSNGTLVEIYVDEQSSLLKNWLLQKGCDSKEEVEILYNLEVSYDKFIHDEEKNDVEEYEEVEEVKVEKKSKRTKIIKDEFDSDEVEFDYKILKKDKIEISADISIEIEDENI
jgi:hypothetical protein